MDLDGTAIVGMACRFPGADAPAAFWRNLRDGVESVTFFSDAELLAAGVSPDTLRDPRYIKASPMLRDIDRFDAAFFGYSPKEATIMDPQHRVFLETCWAAVEDAGYDPASSDGPVVGVFAGAGSAMTSYLIAHAGHPELQGQTAGLEHINNDKDFLATRVSYKLDLTGPSLTVQTACSTSLVAIHLACQSLLAGECDMALAGASTIRVPHISGYLAERGSVHSGDGHCRAFDASGLGTIFGSGVAAVLLKDVRVALADRDHIYAVIRGSAIGNDGARKVSYTAASVQGQARTMVEALEVAGVDPDSIDYVECHATGTRAGDPVEIQALTRAFRTRTSRRAYCAVGSVKTNIGHPEQTAGLAGLVKTALALHHRELPPSLHLETPNPRIPFTDSPFYVQDALAPWPAGEAPRRAGVNSLGIGGTNAFVVLEEPPSPEPRSEPDGPFLHCLSAKTERALHERARGLADFLDTGTAPALSDVCFTANVSRSRLPYRFATVCASTDGLRRQLRAFADHRPVGATGRASPRPITFLFSGQGSQYAGMALELYRTEQAFREAFDACDVLLQPHVGRSLTEVLAADDSGAVDQTRVTQPALFAVEYALAQLWRSWGIVPDAVMGHSVGEIAATCVAGALDLDAAARLVSARASLMQSLPVGGAMAVVFSGEQTVATALDGMGDRCGIAAVNSPRNTVVSGATGAVALVRERLAAEGIESRALTVSHAFHSALMEPALAELEEAATAIDSRAPNVLVVSTLTGELRTDPPTGAYWRDHARQPVRFLDGLRTLGRLEHSLFVEIGPGTGLLTMAREGLLGTAAVFLPSMTRAKSERHTMLESLGRLYVQGATVNWDAIYPRARRVSLPTYPFERKRFWLEPVPGSSESPPVSGDQPAPAASRTPALVGPRADKDPTGVPEAGLERSLYQVDWEAQNRVEPDQTRTPGVWVILTDRGGVGMALAGTMRACGASVHTRWGAAGGSRAPAPDGGRSTPGHPPISLPSSVVSGTPRTGS